MTGHLSADRPLAAPTVSVVLPTHNRCGLLPRAMRSVLDQTYGDLELIVVDDASADDTPKVVRSFDDPRVRYIRLDRNEGAPAARNAGIGAARGPYVAFQDSDDEWAPRKLAEQMTALSTSDGNEIVYCAFIRSRGGSRQRVPGPRHRIRNGEILPALLCENFVSTQTLVVPRHLLDRVGGFDIRLPRFQDWDLAIRLASLARFRLVDEPLVTVHRTAGNISSDDGAGANAMRIMLQTHTALFARWPDARAEFIAGLGHMECVSGEMRPGRLHLVQALRLNPVAPKVWASLLATSLGCRAYRLAHVVGRRLTAPQLGV